MPEISSLAGDLERLKNRSVFFLFAAAAAEVYPEAVAISRFAVNKGLYIELQGLNVTSDVAIAIEEKMHSLVAQDIAIEKRSLPKDKAIAIFKAVGAIPKVNLLNSLELETIDIYYLGQYFDYLYAPVLERTGLIPDFSLEDAPNGVLLRMADASGHIPAPVMQPHLSSLLTESKRWAKILNCEYISDLNRQARSGGIRDIIRISEALHEKKIAAIADQIADGIEKRRLILIAGPSSSGKTSFAQRLRIQLCVNGLSPLSLSLDNYYREKHIGVPRQADGSLDLEALEALDVERFNRDLQRLLAGEAVKLPHYEFGSANVTYPDPPVTLSLEQPIIVEGIHGLNENLTPSLPRDKKFKIYISALTQLSVDMHNRIPTTGVRLVRRLVRDYRYRDASPYRTLGMWDSVRAGEEKNIFPYQEEADAFFNSALIYEMAFLKKYILAILKDTDKNRPEYEKIKQIQQFAGFFADMEAAAEDEIPNNSILREFIGGSVFFDAKGHIRN